VVPLSPVLIAHQEGVVGVVALAGLALRPQGPVAALAPTGPLPVALGVGSAVGLGLAGLMWMARWLPALHELEAFQRELVGGWKVSEAIGVAVLSGAAEEALVRALLQPMVGLWLAALAFAVLHIVPDRRVWMWPLLAFALGLVFGLLYEGWGYPACAIGHVVVNAVGLLRLRLA
jgi:hypothetical protein